MNRSGIGFDALREMLIFVVTGIARRDRPIAQSLWLGRHVSYGCRKTCHGSYGCHCHASHCGAGAIVPCEVCGAERRLVRKGRALIVSPRKGPPLFSFSLLCRGEPQFPPNDGVDP